MLRPCFALRTLRPTEGGRGDCTEFEPDGQGVRPLVAAFLAVPDAHAIGAVRLWRGIA